MHLELLSKYQEDHLVENLRLELPEPSSGERYARRIAIPEFPGDQHEYDPGLLRKHFPGGYKMARGLYGLYGLYGMLASPLF